MFWRTWNEMWNLSRLKRECPSSTTHLQTVNNSPYREPETVAMFRLRDKTLILRHHLHCKTMSKETNWWRKHKDKTHTGCPKSLATRDPQKLETKIA